MSKNTKLIGSNIGSDLINSPIAMLVNGKWQIYTLDTNSNLTKGDCDSASSSKIGSKNPFYTDPGQTLTIINSNKGSTDYVTCKDGGTLHIPEDVGICDQDELTDDSTYSIKYDGSNLVCSNNSPSESRWYCLPEKKMCQLSTSNLADTAHKTRLGCVNDCIPSIPQAISTNNDVLYFPYPKLYDIDSIKKANLFYNTFLVSTTQKKGKDIPLSFALSFPDLFPMNIDNAYFAECKGDEWLRTSGNAYTVGGCGQANPPYSTIDEFNKVYGTYKNKGELQTGFLFPEPNNSALSIGQTKSKTGNKINNIYFCPLYIDNIAIGYKLYTMIDDEAHKIYYYFNPGSSHIDCDDQVDKDLNDWHYSTPKKQVTLTFVNLTSSLFPWTQNLDIFAFTKIDDDSEIVELGIMWQLFKGELKDSLITPIQDPDDSDKTIYYPIYKRPNSSVQTGPVMRLLYGSNGGCGTYFRKDICSGSIEKYYGTLIDEYTVNTAKSWGGDGGARITSFIPNKGCRSIVRSYGV